MKRATIYGSSRLPFRSTDFKFIYDVICDSNIRLFVTIYYILSMKSREIQNFIILVVSIYVFIYKRKVGGRQRERAMAVLPILYLRADRQVLSWSVILQSDR